MLREFHHERRVAVGADASDPNPGSDRPRASSAPLRNRSAGTFASALAITLSTFGGTEPRADLADDTCAVTIFPSTACGVDPVNGGSPTSIS